MNDAKRRALAQFQRTLAAIAAEHYEQNREFLARFAGIAARPNGAAWLLARLEEQNQIEQAYPELKEPTP